MNTTQVQAQNLSETSSSSMFKAVLAGSIGNALEWFDYGIYGYFAAIISTEFFASKDPITALMLSFIVFGVGFVMTCFKPTISGKKACRAGISNVIRVPNTALSIKIWTYVMIPVYVRSVINRPWTMTKLQ